ncbi:hypothetical protein [Clostridium ihumii]|uniref:hypothetical protein n=1 Tax=Clostridium ihumii TaxID=1470356 RepID=UPI0005507E46|nr:hypothetical protein [Clostridium ihumii]
MINVIKIISYIILGSISIIVTTFKDKFDIYAIVLSVFIGIISLVLGFVCKEYENIYNQLTNRNEENKKLNAKISELLITINDKSPYIIQEYIHDAPKNVLMRDKLYNVEIILSTISNDYEIKYLNVSLSKRGKLDQSIFLKQKSCYELKNRYPTYRNGKHEFVFDMKNNERLNSVAKTEFNLSCSEVGEVEMIIEIMGDVAAITKKKTINLKVIE